MTVLSWFLEFINGLVGLVIRFNTTNPYSDANLIVLIVFLDASINFIVIQINSDIQIYNKLYFETRSDSENGMLWLHGKSSNDLREEDGVIQGII